MSEKWPAPLDLTTRTNHGGDVAHGTRAQYQHGCLCQVCRAANSTYELQRTLTGLHGWVDADASMKRLQRLQALGIGSAHAATLTACSRTTIRRIRAGRQRRVQAQTAHTILTVVPYLARGARINAWQTKRWVRALEEDGFTKADLADRAGLPCLQRTLHTRVTVQTYLRVRQLYRSVTAEGADDLNRTG